MVRWLKLVGAGIVSFGVVALMVLLWQSVLVFAAVLILAYGVHVWRQRQAVRRFRSLWQSRGKDLLLVYSNSPHWKEYVEQNWLPRWGARAVVLNWSERRTWDHEHPVEVALFRAFAGEREFNPLAIVVSRKRRGVRVVRFWRAFRDFKHGKETQLRRGEAEVEALLAGPGDA